MNDETKKLWCNHDRAFDLPCGEQECPDCGDQIEVSCENADRKCAYCNNLNPPTSNE